MILAHGIAGRSDLPLSLTLVAYAAGAVLVLSFAALAWLWPRPRWEGSGAGRPVPAGVSAVLRVASWPLRLLSLALLAGMVYSAFAGPDDPQRNLASPALYIVWWVGFLVASGIFGDVWRAIGPVPAIARAFGRSARPYRLGHWPAAAGIGVFTWLELVHPNGASPRIVGVFLVGYLAVTLAGLAVWGRAWAEQGDPFGAAFGVVARMAPVYADDDGRLRLRPPLVGLTALPQRSGTVALVVVVLAGTTYDGVSRTTFWTRLFGEPGTLLATAGLLWTIGAVYALYRLAVTLVPVLAGVPRDDRDPDATANDFVHSLVPIALAYAVAHYFSLLVFEGQSFLALLSDPAGRGWDLFGTSGWRVAYTALSPGAIAYVQTAAIVLGHVAGVFLAHDRAVARYPLKVATRTQYPMLAVMVAYTVGALVILLGG